LRANPPYAQGGISPPKGQIKTEIILEALRSEPSAGFRSESWEFCLSDISFSCVTLRPTRVRRTTPPTRLSTQCDV